MGKGAYWPMESSTGINMPIDTVVIGSGNVASIVVPALEQSGVIAVRQVYSPTESHAKQLSAKLNAAKSVSVIDEVAIDATLYLVAVKDDAIAKIAQQMKRNNAVWLHT